MSDTSPVLFIGGPLDGRRIDVPRRDDFHQTLVRPPLVPLTRHAPAPDEPFPIETVTYRRIRFTRTAEVFAIDGTPAEKVLEALIDAYPQHGTVTVDQGDLRNLLGGLPAPSFKLARKLFQALPQE